jgi:predicted membrane metal-binding protein
MQKTETARELRSFGLIVGAGFGLIGSWPLLRSAEPRWPALALAAGLVLIALIWPTALRLPFRWWMALGHVLGWVNTRLILGALFYTIVLMMSLLLRLLGKDPMHRRFDPAVQSYRVPRNARPGTHMKHQF